VSSSRPVASAFLSRRENYAHHHHREDVDLGYNGRQDENAAGRNSDAINEIFSKNQQCGLFPEAQPCTHGSGVLPHLGMALRTLYLPSKIANEAGAIENQSTSM